MNSNRHLAKQTDEEIVALFKSLFTVDINIVRVVFDPRPLAGIERGYSDQFTRLVERGERNGLGVLALENATSLDGKVGMVLGIDLGPVRAWTFLNKAER